MGRPSNLTDKQWGEIGKRLANGEGVSDLAREFKVSKSSISSRFSKRIETLKTIANNIVQNEKALNSLPLSEQCSVLNMVDHLKAIGNNIAQAASIGSATSAKLAKLAHDKLQGFNPNSDDMLEDLKGIAALQRVSNDAATLGTAFMAANKPKAEPATGEGNEDELLRRISELLPN